MPLTPEQRENGSIPVGPSNPTSLEQHEAIARVCHEANRAYCLTLGDTSQLAWESAPEWQRANAIASVIFNLGNPSAPASASHESWLKEKAASGWKYGAVKDAEKKEHPCFVPCLELPEAQRRKDHLFKAIVGALSPSNVSDTSGQTGPPEHIEQFFAYAHLPSHLQEVSRPFSEMKDKPLEKLPRNPERIVAPRCGRSSRSRGSLLTYGLGALGKPGALCLCG